MINFILFYFVVKFGQNLMLLLFFNIDFRCLKLKMYIYFRLNV